MPYMQCAAPSRLLDQLLRFRLGADTDCSEGFFTAAGPARCVSRAPHGPSARRHPRARAVLPVLVLTLRLQSIGQFLAGNSESLLEFPIISRWLDCFVAEELQTESSTGMPRFGLYRISTLVIQRASQHSSQSAADVRLCIEIPYCPKPVHSTGSSRRSYCHPQECQLPRCAG